MDYAQRCGYHRLGVAFLFGPFKEASVFVRVLRANGFAVESASVQKRQHAKDCRDRRGGQGPSGTNEIMCNPAVRQPCSTWPAANSISYRPLRGARYAVHETFQSAGDDFGYQRPGPGP
jgi:hypothetical protein